MFNLTSASISYMPLINHHSEVFTNKYEFTEFFHPKKYWGENALVVLLWQFGLQSPSLVWTPWPEATCSPAPIHIPSHVQSRDPSTYMWSVNFARVEKIMKPETFPFLKKGSTLGTIFVPFLYHRDPLHLPAFDLSTLPELRKKENLSLSPISAYPKLNFNRVGKK